MNKTITITFITPCFCRGADCSENGEPEIRPASIRGQLHWWFRALGGTPEEENAVFGTIHGTPSASKIVVRVRMADQSRNVEKQPTLPHKPGGPGAPKKAFKPGTSFELLLSWRRGGVAKELSSKFNRALDAWLHMGALGLRATRGGGNFTWEGQPSDPGRYAEIISDLTKGTKVLAGLLNGTPFPSAEAARRVITDTLAEGAFIDVKRPLGGIKQGGRKTSPLRFRIVRFADDDFRILAVWDGRSAVTGNRREHLRSAVGKLVEGGKKIGALLNNSALMRPDGNPVEYIKIAED